MADSTVEDVKTEEVVYMEKVIKASKLINMWPNTRNKNFFSYHLFVWAIIIYTIFFIASFIIQITNDFNNLDSVTALIDFVTVFISGTFRYIYIYVRGDKYIHLASMIRKKFIRVPFYSGKNKPTLKTYYAQANRLIFAYGTFTFFWIVQVCVTPIISYTYDTSNLSLDSNQTEPEPIPYPVPMKVYAPFDYHKQPGNTIFYLYQTAGFMLFGFIYIVVDSFWYMVTFLTMGQFILIEHSLHTIAESLKKTESAQEVQLWDEGRVKKLEYELNKCIKHHQFIREFLVFVENLNNPNVLVDSLHAAISIGFILLDTTIALNTRDFNKVMYSLEYLATSIIHMFFFDWLASQLIEKEENLAEAAYEIQWYRCPSVKVQLMLLMMQSRRPCRLSGGKMYQLSLSFFTSMLKAVFSYFTFLFQLRNDQPMSMG